MLTLRYIQFMYVTWVNVSYYFANLCVRIFFAAVRQYLYVCSTQFFSRTCSYGRCQDVCLNLRQPRLKHTDCPFNPSCVWDKQHQQINFTLEAEEEEEAAIPPPSVRLILLRFSTQSFGFTVVSGFYLMLIQTSLLFCEKNSAVSTLPNWFLHFCPVRDSTLGQRRWKTLSPSTLEDK